MFQRLSFALGPLHFRVARLSFVPVGPSLILEPFSLMLQPLRFIAHKSSFTARLVRFAAVKFSFKAKSSRFTANRWSWIALPMVVKF